MDHRRAVFFDRDGTLCVDRPYASRPEDLELMPSAAAAVRAVRRAGLLAILVTNQSGIARGLFSEGELVRMHEKLQADLAAEGATLDAVYHCPHHPDEGCRCRKPGTKLVEDAARDFRLDLSRCFVIGDRRMDVDLALAFGGTAVLIPGAISPEERHEASRRAAHVAADLGDAIDWVLAHL